MPRRSSIASSPTGSRRAAVSANDAGCVKRQGRIHDPPDPTARPMLAIVDTGPILSAADPADADHELAVAALTRPGLRLVFPHMVIFETAYLIGSRLGA